MSLWKFLVILSILGVLQYTFQDSVEVARVEDYVKKAMRSYRVKYKDGMLIMEEPSQMPTNAVDIEYKSYVLKPKYIFAMRGRVLGKKRYLFDRESEIAPYDFVLGWREMSDQRLVDKTDIKQALRFHELEYDGVQRLYKVLSQTSSNMHLIPADDTVLDVMRSVSVDDIVIMKGLLVDVTAPKGWIWRTSVLRDDVGENASEVVWVKEMKIISQKYPRAK